MRAKIYACCVGLISEFFSPIRASAVNTDVKVDIWIISSIEVSEHCSSSLFTRQIGPLLSGEMDRSILRSSALHHLPVRTPAPAGSSPHWRVHESPPSEANHGPAYCAVALDIRNGSSATTYRASSLQFQLRLDFQRSVKWCRTDADRDARMLADLRAEHIVNN